jgi:hypothetical protein
VLLRRASPAQPETHKENDMSDIHGWKPVAQDDGDDDDDEDGDEEEDE